MSFWLKLGLKITDLTCFKASCKKHGIEYVENQDENFKMKGSPVHAVLHDTRGGSKNTGYLVRQGGGFKLVVDSDPHYSTITRRLGANGGKLTRDYACGVVEKNVIQSGGMIDSSEEMSDGSMVIRAHTM